MSHDPWALLREARDQLVGVQGMVKVTQTIARIDAALAGRAEGSTESTAEWRPSDQRVFLDGVSLRVVLHTDGLWVWSVYWPLSHRTEQGRVATEEEAKSAAIAAARGLR